ncbi:MAG: hypothetical protein ACHQ4G_03040 [Opitutales bacterium]
MISNLIHILTRRPAPAYEHSFVQEVSVRHRMPPNPRVELFIMICWLLIAVKHAAVLYACYHWPVPFNALWINAPTFALGLLATVVYYWRH